MIPHRSRNINKFTRPIEQLNKYLHMNRPKVSLPLDPKGNSKNQKFNPDLNYVYGIYHNIPLIEELGGVLGIVQESSKAQNGGNHSENTQTNHHGNSSYRQIQNALQA